MHVKPGVEVASLSDVGCQRENNEDSYLYWEPSDNAEFRRKGRLAVIADGMGGHEGGQEASRLAVETPQESYAHSVIRGPRNARPASFITGPTRHLNSSQPHPSF